MVRNGSKRQATKKIGVEKTKSAEFKQFELFLRTGTSKTKERTRNDVCEGQQKKFVVHGEYSSELVKTSECLVVVIFV